MHKLASFLGEKLSFQHLVHSKPGSGVSELREEGPSTARYTMGAGLSTNLSEHGGSEAIIKSYDSLCP